MLWVIEGDTRHGFTWVAGYADQLIGRVAVFPDQARTESLLVEVLTNVCWPAVVNGASLGQHDNTIE